MSNFKDFEQVIGTQRDRTDYSHDAPSQQEFFAQIQQRETALKALHDNTNLSEEGKEYRESLVSLIDRQSPFERYVINVWERVQRAGWNSAEKFRLKALFGTDDNFKIAYMMAKKEFAKLQQDAIINSYARHAESKHDSLVEENMGGITEFKPARSGTFTALAGRGINRA